MRRHLVIWEVVIDFLGFCVRVDSYNFKGRTWGSEEDRVFGIKMVLRSWKSGFEIVSKINSIFN